MTRWSRRAGPGTFAGVTTLTDADRSDICEHNNAATAASKAQPSA